MLRGPVTKKCMKMHFTILHNYVKSILTVKESYFKDKGGQTNLQMLTIRLERMTPPLRSAVYIHFFMPPLRWWWHDCVLIWWWRMVGSGLVMLSPEKWRKSYNPQIVTHHHHHNIHCSASSQCSVVPARSQGQRVKSPLLLEKCDVV